MKSSIALVLAICAVGSLADLVKEKVGIDGKCPLVPFVGDFDGLKFLGKWFAIRETGKEIPCVTYELDEPEPNHFHAFVTPKNFTMEFDKKNVDDWSQGLGITFKINPFMDGGELRIFATDYGELNERLTLDDLNLIKFVCPTVNYAGIFICKESEGVHYQTISFWSRTKILSDEAFTSLNAILSKHEAIDVSYMKAVNHDDCEIVVWVFYIKIPSKCRKLWRAVNWIKPQTFLLITFSSFVYCLI